MALEIDEDDVLPGTLPGRARLDLREVDAVARERLQDPIEGPGHVAHREEDRGLVAPRGTDGPATDDEEARRVLRIVLDARPQEGNVIEAGGKLGGDRRPRRVGRAPARRRRTPRRSGGPGGTSPPRRSAGARPRG